ncbi:MAG: endonuclease NucS domain-containing protein [Nostoc sp. EfeVER01]|uniref:endonuclease NucS domain-containing protein n=1 Tax=unclassified Nostoc TaxID=2593658 RepID=UPI002AD434A2|nr:MULTISPECIES: endonuclease NucS domain-containing protein [unclassified Nostoc]MDZ7945377.1 endonuclease NucS [Nostoc sp. EfeVER01]MDZ7993412.1 endonuclease NucS [Nostoc sp. EspVER01]
MNLIKTGNSWKFATEADLEDFVWANLKELFGLIPLKRQYYVKGQICDILALREDKQLVVLELKNAEDRYIVQQLTRYYDALQEIKPLEDEIDYQQPIGLIAIKPNFHRDNFIDKKYHHLSIDFFEFAVLLEEFNYYLQIKNLDNEKVLKIEIPHQNRERNSDIPPSSRGLLNRLAKCSYEQQEEILKIRQKVLTFDKRMEEISSVVSFKYGNGNSKTSKFCAEFYFDSKGIPIIFLWLGLKNNKSDRISRARIWTDWQDNALLEGYVPSGIGVKMNLSKKTLSNRVKIMNEIVANKNSNYRTNKYFSQYSKDRNRITKKLNNSEPLTYEERQLLEIDANEFTLVIGGGRLNTYKFERYDSLNGLVDVALEKWLKRL